MTLPEKTEPSVLDYLKGKIFPGRNPVIEIPETELNIDVFPVVEKTRPEKKNRKEQKSFWQLLLVLILLITGQKLLEPPTQFVPITLAFWGCAIALVIRNWFRGKFETSLYPVEDDEPADQAFHPIFLWISLGMGLAAAFLFINNRFTGINVGLWCISIISLLLAFFPQINWRQLSGTFNKIYANIFHSGFHFRISPWTLLILLSFIVVCFLRFYRLDQVPIEMISDQAEKLLDVNDILGGTFSIFFPRNTGREAFQMYLSALMSVIFGTGISFLTLKIGTAIMGVITAIYLYFLGKEVGNRWVGLFALILCGIGYWPNVISRIGLRFTLYSAFTAPALYYFFKGMRRKRWSDLVLAGISIGLGLHGYSPFRMVPILLIIGVVLYILHYTKISKQKFAIAGLVVVGLAALIIFLPLLRYMLDQPELLAYRTLTRTASWERPLPGPAWKIFLSNLWWAVIMPFWKNGTIWAHSIPGRPALDVVTAAMFLIGLVVSVLRYIQQKDWRILFIILSIPFLMMPSIFSLAFPGENPCLNRTAGALVPIFLIAALGSDTLLQNIKKQVKGVDGSIISASICGLMLITSVIQNFNLVFVDYDKIYKKNSLNTSQIGGVIRNFVDLYGDPDSAYVVGYPYWVDTRLVGINAGFPKKDYAIWPDQFNETLVNKRAKLFILYSEDTGSLDQLRQMYPNYFETLYKGWVPRHDFIVFLVPPSINSLEEVGTPVP